MTGWLPRFPIVGAASICAKVVRDQELTNWEVKEKGIQCSKEFGCGYPAGAESLAGNQGTLSLVVIQSLNSGVVKKPLASRFWLSLVGALFMVHSCYTHREERRSCRMVMLFLSSPRLMHKPKASWDCRLEAERDNSAPRGSATRSIANEN